jgi:hypothetical protein
MALRFHQGEGRQKVFLGNVRQVAFLQASERYSHRCNSQEALMLRPQGLFKPVRRRNLWNTTASIFAVNGAILLILIGLVIGCPPASKWIAEAVQAEFATTTAPEVPPTQIAQPAQQMHGIRND